MTGDEHAADYVGEAVRALTAAARRTYTTADGRTCRYDFGETVCHVLAAVAANVGGIDAEQVNRSAAQAMNRPGS